MKKNKNKKSGAAKKTKDESSKDEAAKEETSKDDAAAEEPSKEEATEEPAAEAAGTEAPTDSEEKADDKAVDEDDKPAETSPSSTPSLAQQSKLRSTSFRAGTSGSPLSPDGDTAPDIYRKNVAKIEELEKENKRLEKESADAEKRWKKAEEELADLREAEGDATKGDKGDAEELVWLTAHKFVCTSIAALTWITEERDCFTSEKKQSTATTSLSRLRPSPFGLNVRPAARPASSTRREDIDHRIDGD